MSVMKPPHPRLIRLLGYLKRGSGKPVDPNRSCLRQPDSSSRHDQAICGESEGSPESGTRTLRRFS